MHVRNILILFLCQMISATGAIVLVTLGGIIGSKLTANPALATLPISVMVISVAATAIPASILMKRIGRKLGFTIASLVLVYFIVQGIKAIGNFIVRRKARAKKKTRDQG